MDVDNVSEASFASAEGGKPIICNPLLPHEMISLNNKLKRIIIIQEVDRIYHMALNDIRDQLIISIVVEPSFYGRHMNKSVMVIATANNTYLFDLKALGKIFSDLSQLLKAECPRKIMHYSHRICDLLFHHFNIRVNGVCDTFVAWCVARQDMSHFSLIDAILLTFDLRASQLTCRELYSLQESVRTFNARPLTKNQVRYLGKLAILQQKLHDTLIYENILGNMQQLTLQVFSNTANTTSDKEKLKKEINKTQLNYAA